MTKMVLLHNHIFIITTVQLKASIVMRYSEINPLQHVKINKLESWTNSTQFIPLASQNVPIQNHNALLANMVTSNASPTVIITKTNDLNEELPLKHP